MTNPSEKPACADVNETERKQTNWLGPNRTQSRIRSVWLIKEYLETDSSSRAERRWSLCFTSIV